VLFNFTGGKDGREPEAGLTFGTAGNLYTTTSRGPVTNCPEGCGTVFELTPGTNGKWPEKILHSFYTNGPDGVFPEANVLFDKAGNFCGTTVTGATYQFGAEFELIPNHGQWTAKLLHAFNQLAKDGANPKAGMILDKAGNLYGTTLFGGSSGGNGSGIVFEVTP
jgi:hypothetical protein